MVSIDNGDVNCDVTVVLILVVVVVPLMYFSEFEYIPQVKTENLR